jgi:hypothetical protein
VRNRAVISGGDHISDEAIAPALDALRENPADPGAIFAVGFGERDDYLPQITQILRSNINDSTIVNACLYALAEFSQIGSDATAILVELLNQRKSHNMLPGTLIREGSDIAANALFNYLKSILAIDPQLPYSTSIVYEAFNILQFLLSNPSTQESTIEVCRERILRGEALDSFSEELVRILAGDSQQNDADADYRIAAYKLLDCGRVRQFLEYEAFQVSRGIRFVGNKDMSIRGLGAFERDDAYLAALRTLQDSEAHDREHAPYTLLDIDSRRAADDLLAHLAEERSIVVRTNIARAIVSHEPSIASLLDRLKDAEHTIRQMACFALGFARPSIEIEMAIRSCLQDSHADVYRSACESLNRLYHATCTEEIICAFAEEPDISKQWILLDAALEIGDIGSKYGPKHWWIDSMRSKMTPFMFNHMSKTVEKRRKEEISELEREDRREK